MQVDRMRHHRRADETDRERERTGVGNLRHDRMPRRRAPIDRCDEHLDQVAKPDDADEAADDQLDWPEAETFERQDAVGDDRRDDHSDDQRHLEQQREPDGAAEELGEISRHGGDLAYDPHAPDGRPGKLLAAHFREVTPGDDAELGRQRLEQHRNQVGEQHHPEQAIAVLGARLNVGGEVAGVDIGDRGDNSRPDKGQITPQPAALALQHALRGRTGPLSQ